MFWNLILGIASFALQLLLAPKPQNAKPAALEDFDAPVAEEGLEIPDVFGTEVLRAPNVVWYGDLGLDPIKGPRRYLFFGPRQILGYKYKLGMQMVLCAGPADKIIEIRVGDKVAYDQETTGGTISIDKADLFGGDQSEGGVVGLVDVNMGGPAQAQDTYLLAKLGALLPAFRGVVSLVLRQVYLGTSTYIKPWEVTLQRIFLQPGGADQWYPPKAAIPREGSGSTYTKRDVTDFGGGFFDMTDTVIVHENAAQTAFVVEDLRSGTVAATIPKPTGPASPARIVSVCSATNQLMVFASDNNLYVYDLADGSLVQTMATWSYNQLGSNGWNFPLQSRTCAEYVDGDTTYVFYQTIWVLVCLKNGGSGWSVAWTLWDWGFAGNFNGMITVGPTYLVMRVASGAWWRIAWTATAGSGATSIYFPGLVGSSESVLTIGTHSIAYIPGTDQWFATFSGFDDNITAATFNSDLTAAVATETGVGWGAGPNPGFADTLPMASKHMVYGSTSARFFYHASSADDYVYLYDASTATRAGVLLVSQWGYASALSGDSGWSATESAYVIMDSTAGGGSGGHVLFLPTGGQDMNPAHIIRECITARMGYADADIEDDDSEVGFTVGADTLFEEGFGLTLKWAREEEIGEFINMVLAHIDAYLYISRTTGKFNLKLVRNDYNVETIPEITEDDVDGPEGWVEIQRRGLSDAVNSVMVKYTDRLARGRDASHQVDNIAQMQMMDGLRVSATRNYPGISYGSLAVRVGQRDVKALGIGMISGTIKCKRTVEPWVNPGQPFRLVSERHGLSGEVMRVAELDFGNGEDNRITIKFVQDVFGLPDEPLVDTAASDWENPASPPGAVSPRLVWEMPYLQLRRFTGAASTAEALATDPDFGAVEVAGGRPSADATQAIISTKKNAGSYADRELMNFAPSAVLDGAIDEQATSIPLTDDVDITLIEDGMMAAIEGNSRTASEIIRIDSRSTLTLTASRGLLDTVPRQHPDAAELVGFDDFSQTDAEPYTATDNVAVRLRPTTAYGTLSLSLAPLNTVNLDSRAIRPYRPADVQVNSIGYGPVDISGLSPVPTSWARRNRLTETTPLEWTDADQAPESGQTTSIRILDPGGVVIDDTTYTGISGTSQDIDPADFGGATTAILEFLSVRDGYDSWQAYRIAVFFTDGLMLEGDETDGDDLLILEGDESGDLLLEGST